MILHIAPDDKFLDVVFDLFEEVLPERNEFIIITYDKKKRGVKFISNSDRVKLLTPNNLLEESFVRNLENYNLIILHFLDDAKVQLVNKSDDKINYMWLSWGADFYNDHPAAYDNLYQHNTKEIFFLNISLVKRLKRKIKYLLAKQNFSTVYYKKFFDKKRAIRRIKYISTVTPEDQRILKKMFSIKDKIFIRFFYVNVEDTILMGINNNINLGENILVGNSSTPTNNHLEIFQILKNMDLKDKKVIVPLSYGDVAYQKLIISEGEKLLGSSFLPVTEFMTLENYNNLISSCGYVIMNHKRQQAMGNIHTLMYLGSKIFISHKSPSFNFFKRQGVHIFPVKDLIKRKEKALIPLAEEYVKYNKEFVVTTRSRKAMLENIKQIAMYHETER